MSTGTRAMWSLNVLLLGAGCSHGTATSSDPDAAVVIGVDAGASADTAVKPTPTTLAWPAASATIAGATTPALALVGGKQVLTFTRNYKLLVLADAVAGGMPLEVGAGSDTYDVRAAAPAASSGESIVLWSQGLHSYLSNGVPNGAGISLINADITNDIAHLGVTWSGARPIAALQVMFNLGARTSFFALALGPQGSAPPAAVLLSAPSATVLQGFGESPSVLDLQDGRALLFAPTGEVAPNGYGTLARWYLVGPDPAGGASAFLLQQSTGQLQLPGDVLKNRDWIQVHDLGAGKAAFTWAQTSPSNAVYDVFLSTLTVAADGTPALGATFVNVSNTTGQVDNSDFPVVRSTGDGRLWITWREAKFGPRVALYDAQLKRIGIIAPDVELNCDSSQSISAVVDSTGALHMAAVVRPDTLTPEVRTWIIARPSGS